MEGAWALEMGDFSCHRATFKHGAWFLEPTYDDLSVHMAQDEEGVAQDTE